MKKILTIIFLLLFVLSFAVFATEALAKKKKTTGNKYKVALLISLPLGNNSLFDAYYKGAKEAIKKHDIKLSIVNVNNNGNNDPRSWENVFLMVARQGHDLIICPTSEFAELVKWHASSIPSTKFVIIDAEVTGDNVTSVLFDNKQGGFMAGVVAAFFTQTKTVGFLGGIDIPPVRQFLDGFKEGVRYVDRDTIVEHRFAGTFANQSKGREIALRLNEKGADIIFNVAGGITGSGIFEASQKTKKFFVIGVDIDQSPLYPAGTLTSIVKRYDKVCYDLIANSIAEDARTANKKIVHNFASGGLDMTEIKQSMPVQVKVNEIKTKLANKEIDIN